MAYTKTNWQKGDIVTSQRLNKIENELETLDTSLDNKVNSVSGKGLSTNDYTTEDKNKLTGIASGAEVNVQSDWNQTNSSADSYIKNKPEIPTVDSSLSSESTNPVQNKAVYSALNNKQDILVSGINIKTINNQSLLEGGNITIEGGGGGSGTVTSVRVQATSPVNSSVSTNQTTSLNTTISLNDAYGDTKNPYGSKTKNQVLAAPSNANGVPSFRALTADDIPDLSDTYLTLATLPIYNGGVS